MKLPSLNKWVSGKEGCKGRSEAATVSDISYTFGLGHFILIRKKSESVCGNHVCGQSVDFFWNSIWALCCNVQQNATNLIVFAVFIDNETCPQGPLKVRLLFYSYSVQRLEIFLY